MKNMGRYLMYISYLGTQFRATQKQVTRLEPNKPDPDSIQGILEICSKLLKPVNEPYVYVSSRTDQGVHALRSSAHVDLEHPKGTVYDTEHLPYFYNHFFRKAKLNLRIQGVQLVPDEFHCRKNAKSRTYLYRLAVRKANAPTLRKNNDSYAEIPIIESDRCYFIQNPEFDMTKIEDAIKLFPGKHDFRSFMNHRKDFEGRDTVRQMFKLEICPGTPLMSHCSENSYYNYWNITCQAKSFLYKQVRRIVGALIAVAQGTVTTSDIRHMLEVPSKDSWNNRIYVVPPHGLYLLNVEYDQNDLLFTSVKEDKLTAEIVAMSLLEQLQHCKKTLRPCETTVTMPSGQCFKEKLQADGSTAVIPLDASSLQPGFVVDTKPDLQVVQVLPGLYMGSQDVAADIELLKHHCITHVLSLGVQAPKLNNSVIYHYIELLDTPETNILHHLQHCFNIINYVREAGESIYVHCNAGVSRSASVVIAYVMNTKKMKYKDAFIYLKEKRACIKPNAGFINQLLEYERILEDGFK